MNQQLITDARFRLANPDVTHTPDAHLMIIAGLLDEIGELTKGSERNERLVLPFESSLPYERNTP